MSESNQTRRFHLPVEPVLIGVALLVLLMVGWWLAVTPRSSQSDGSADSVRLAALEQRLAALEPLRERSAQNSERLRALDVLESRLRSLEQRPTATDQGGRLTLLEQRLAAVEQRGDLSQRVQALEQRPDLAARVLALESRPAPPDLGSRVQALEARPQPDLRPLEARIAALEQRPDPMPLLEARMAALQVGLAENLRAVYGQLQGRMRGIDALRARLAAGQPLGEALEQAGATDPALTRFAAASPPTEPALRLQFQALARQLRGRLPGENADGSRPGFWDSALASLKGLVTLRRGDQVILGDTAEPALERIERLLAAGDLPGAIAAQAQLPPSVHAALQPWSAQAEALAAARAALARLAVGG